MKKCAHPGIPEPAEIHGWTLVNGHLEPLRILGNIMPDPVADLMEDIPHGDDQDSEEENATDNDDDDDNEDNEEEVDDDVILNLIG